MMAISSCIYDYPTACEDDSELTIVNDWQFAPDASPEGMAYLFFPSESIEPWRFDFPGRDAGKITLPIGKYRFVMFNDDTSAIRFRIDNNTLEAYCREGDILEGLGRRISDPSPDPPVAERVEICPDMMWSASSPYVDLGYDKLVYDQCERGTAIKQVNDDGKIFRTFPQQIIARYNYEIHDVSNLSGVKQMCAAMSGMASGIMLGDNIPSSTAVTVPFAASRSGSNTITGQFLTFGLPQPYDPAGSPNILHLFVWLTDNRRMEYLFDVTDQVANAADPLCVHISLSGLQLPEPSPTGEPGMFEPTVDGWNTIEINIES